MNIPALFEQMIVLFLTLIIGFVASKTGIMTEDANKNISKLVAKVTNPLRIVSSVLTGQRLLSNFDVLLMTLIAAGGYVFLISTSLALPKLLHVKREHGGLYRFMYIFSNINYIGYPLVAALFGPGAMFHVTIFVLAYQIICWSYGVHLISGEERFRPKWSALLTPCIAAALLAYVIYLTDLPVPKVLAQTAESVGSMTSPLAMLIIGCSLGRLSFRSIFGQWRLYVLSALKLIVLPILTYFLLRGVIANELILGVTVISMALPTATNTTIISYEYNADGTLASSGVFMTTLLSVATIPLVMQLLFG